MTFIGLRFNAQILACTLIGLCGPVAAQPLNRLSTFKSSGEFVESLRRLEPEKQPNIYSRTFGIEDFGEGGRDALILPTKIESVTELWRNNDHALVFATARPPTQASTSEVGVLIVLTHVNDSWRLQSYKRYETIGKYAKIECEITSAGDKPTERGHDDAPAILTFRRSSGGRGASESTSWSLIFTGGTLKEHH